MGGGEVIPPEHVKQALYDWINSPRHDSYACSSSDGGNRVIENLVTSEASCQDLTEQFPLRIITHNIRYAATTLFDGERPWKERLPYLLRQFYHYVALPFAPAGTIICMQEVLHSQLRDLALSFDAELQPAGQTWSYVGVGRDDGQQAGEYNPIFYRPDYWKRIDSGTIWLSDTPNRPSRGWDAGSNRLCTILVLESRPKLFGKTMTILIMNTHLDNVSHKARQEGAKLILKFAKIWNARYETDRIILTGDLNSTRDEDDGAWQVFNTSGSGFSDAESLLSGWREPPVKHFGDVTTFTGFDSHGDGDDVGTLDFVHVGPGRGPVKVHSHTVVPNLFEDGIRCSDHRAVVVDLLLGS